MILEINLFWVGGNTELPIRAVVSLAVKVYGMLSFYQNS
jgi:hypothetical protein